VVSCANAADQQLAYRDQRGGGNRTGAPGAWVIVKGIESGLKIVHLVRLTDKFDKGLFLEHEKQGNHGLSLYFEPIGHSDLWVNLIKESGSRRKND